MADLKLNAIVKLDSPKIEIDALQKKIQAQFNATPINVKFGVDSGKATSEAKAVISTFQKEIANLQFGGNFFKSQSGLLSAMGLDSGTINTAKTELNGLEDSYRRFAEAMNSGDAAKIKSSYADLYGHFGQYSAILTNARKDVQSFNKELSNSEHVDRAMANVQRYFDKYRSQIENNGALLKEFQIIQEKTLSGGYDGDTGWHQLQADLAKFGRSCQEAGIEVETLQVKIGKLFNAHLSTALIMVGINALRSVIQELYTNVKDLDKAVVDLQIASGMSRSGVQSLMSDYSALGKQIGATTLEVAKSSDTWLRQGYSMEDANKLIRDSMMLSKLGQIDSAEAAIALTSAMKGYKVSVEDVTDVVSRFVAVDMVASTSAGDIATAMSRTAVGADLAGVSMNRLTGYIAKVAEVTQAGAEEVGNFYKTLFARMGNIREGKLLDPENQEDLSNVERTLAGVGIQLRNSGGEFRDFGDVLDDVSAKWDSYGTVQQRAIAVAFSGVRQQEKFLVLMENYDDAIGLAEVAANSGGTATEKYGAYMDGLEAHVNSLRAAFESLSTTLLNSEGLKDLVDWATSAITVIDKLTSSIGIIPTAITALGASMGAKGTGIIGKDGNSNEFAPYSGVAA